MGNLETSIMSHDQHALRDAYNLVEKYGERLTGSPKLIKKLDQIADRPGLSERTCMVIRYATEKCREGSASFAWRILWDEMNRLEQPEE